MQKHLFFESFKRGFECFLGRSREHKELWRPYSHRNRARPGLPRGHPSPCFHWRPPGPLPGTLPGDPLPTLGPACLPYPNQEAIWAGELVVPEGLVHDQEAAHDRHDEGQHTCGGHLQVRGRRGTHGGWGPGPSLGSWGSPHDGVANPVEPPHPRPPTC